MAGVVIDINEYSDRKDNDNPIYWTSMIINIIISGTLSSVSLYFSLQKNLINHNVLVINTIFLFLTTIFSSSTPYHLWKNTPNFIYKFKYIVSTGFLLGLSAVLITEKQTTLPVLIFAIFEFIYAFSFLLGFLLFHIIYCIYNMFQKNKCCDFLRRLIF